MTSKALIIVAPTRNAEQAVLAVQKELAQRQYDVAVLHLSPLFENELVHVDVADLGLVVAIGGDGTVRSAAQLIISKVLNVPLLIIPRGSANIIAKSLRISKSITRAFRNLDSRGAEKIIDVGLINDKHYFVVGVSLGHVSEIVTATTHQIKSYFGLAAYLLQAIINPPKQEQIFTLTHRDATEHFKANSLIIFNAVNIYGLKPRRTISSADGILNLYAIRRQNIFTMIRLAFDFLWYHMPPQHLVVRDGDQFQITLDAEAPAQIDGDPIILGTEINVRLLPQALRVIVK